MRLADTAKDMAWRSAEAAWLLATSGQRRPAALAALRAAAFGVLWWAYDRDVETATDAPPEQLEDVEAWRWVPGGAA